ncbi:MAG: hypothetical protein CMB80_05590, partial [Flammeovirgaceae bacterium]|nr:hypothetical protein [Flammeovirgaceae bacterium]
TFVDDIKFDELIHIDSGATVQDDAGLFILADGSNPLTSDWNAGSFDITADAFHGVADSATTATNALSLGGIAAASYKTEAEFNADISGSTSQIPYFDSSNSIADSPLDRLTADRVRMSGQIYTTTTNIGFPGTGNETFDMDDGMVHRVNIPSSGNVRILFTGGQAGGRYILIIQNSSSTGTFSFGNTMYWPDGTAVTALDGSASSFFIIGLIKGPGGNWYVTDCRNLTSVAGDPPPP